MSRLARAAFFVGVFGCVLAGPAYAQGEQQELVDRATLAAQDMLNDQDGRDAQDLLRRARAVMICPQVFQAGFLFGAQGGGCVMAGKDARGNWSPPAFFGVAGASFGFQAGMQDTSVMMFILNPRAVMAVMDNQFKLGADAGATFVQWGGGVEGATTTAMQADIVAFSRSRGLFAGISLGGSILSPRTGWNERYYGHILAAQQIVLNGEGQNIGADPLREVLLRAQRSAEGQVPMAAADAGPGPVGPSQASPSPASYPAPLAARPGSVQATPLAPPRR